jgi:hypothetical protein
MKTCPDCLSEIPAAACVCRYCGERVEGVQCPQCGARNWEHAALCRWCSQPFERSRGQMTFAPFTVVAQLLPTILLRGRLLPQTISLTHDKILLCTPGPFRLFQRDEEIPWAKVAGFNYKSGIFWDEVTIETRGQSSTKVGALAKADGQRIRQVLQKLET